MYSEIVMMLASAAIAARATRLVTRDVIAQPVRNLAGNYGLATFIACPWCVGFWIALAAFAGGYAVWSGHDWSGPQLFVWVAAAAATNLAYATVASATGRVAELADSAEIRLHDHRRVSL